MSLNQFLVILRARWQIAICTFLAVVLLVTFTSLIWPKQYTATASIVIDSKSDPVADRRGRRGGRAAAGHIRQYASRHHRQPARGSAGGESAEAGPAA